MIKKEKILILGYGEVGRSLSYFYDKPFIKDLKRNDIQNSEKVDILNICIPASDNFIKIVSKNIKSYAPKLAIIHSTVVPGTTLSLYKKFKNVVHSPIRGMHPNLYKGVKTFVKYVGADDRRLGQIAANHLKKIGIKNVKIFTPSATTELGKLLDTTYYGVCIAFHDYAANLCRKLAVDFEKAITDFNKTYNEGYKKIGKSNVVRPVLFPPVGGIIGGHCILPNARILKQNFGSDAIIETVLRHDKKKN